MLIYNSQLKSLALPEYGRNIQQMVDYCVTIEDRDERNKCARSIVASMGNLFPELRDEPDYTHKLWDHLAIMSEFRLDIDYPFEVLKKENLGTRPAPLDYKLEHITLRHYGKVLERMIERACEYPEGKERDTLVMMLANHMKKSLYQINADDIDDARVFKDLAFLSRGRIVLDPAKHPLHEYKLSQPKQPQQPAGKKKKKR